MIKFGFKIAFLFLMLSSMPAYSYVIQCEITKNSQGQKIDLIPFTIKSPSSKITLYGKVDVRINGGSPLSFSTREVNSGTILFTDSDANLYLTPKGNNKFDVDSWSNSGGGLFLDAFPHMSVAGLCSTKKEIIIVNKPIKTIVNTGAGVSVDSKLAQKEFTEAEATASLNQGMGELLTEGGASNQNSPRKNDVRDELESIKTKARDKNFGFLNNPGKEIKKLLSESKVKEAYYIHQYHSDFFDKQGAITGKLNSVKFRGQLKELAKRYYEKDLAIVSKLSMHLSSGRSERDNVEGWREVQKTFDAVERVLESSHDGSEYSSLIRYTRLGDLRYKLTKAKDHFRVTSAVKRLFEQNAFKIDGLFFDVYPKVFTKKRTVDLTKLWVRSLYSDKVITVNVFNKYKTIYDFSLLLTENAVNKIKARESAEYKLDDGSTNLFQLFRIAGDNNDSDFLIEVLNSRDIGVKHPQPSDKFPLTIKCLPAKCLENKNADVQIIITLEDKRSNILQIGTFNKNVRVKSGTNVVPNPTYNRLVNQLNSLSRKIQAKRRQQQINQQANSNNTYKSDCTAFGSNINCTTTQQPNDYAIGYQGGALMGQGLNALFGLKTEEDQYREVENKLSRTSPTTQQQAYSYQNIEIPEYEVTKSAKGTVHIFDVKNKEYQSVPVLLSSSEKWLVPNSESVFSLPLQPDVKKRLLSSNLISLKVGEYLTLDVISILASALSNGSLTSHKYIEPGSLILREETKIVALLPKVEGQVPTPSSVVSADAGYYELLGNDEFIGWAKSDPILNRLLQGFVEGNESAVSALRKKWLEVKK